MDPVSEFGFSLRRVILQVDSVCPVVSIPMKRLSATLSGSRASEAFEKNMVSKHEAVLSGCFDNCYFENCVPAGNEYLEPSPLSTESLRSVTQPPHLTI